MTPTYSEAKVRDNRFRTLQRNAWRLRCPVCKEGKIFSGWFRTETTCPTCHVTIEREEGFFLGSIYFNYGMTCVITMAAFLLGRFVLDLPETPLMAGLVVFVIVFPCFFFRYARSSFLAFDQFFHPRLPPDLAPQER